MGGASSIAWWFPDPKKAKDDATNLKKLMEFAKTTEVKDWLKKYRDVRLKKGDFHFQIPMKDVTFKGRVIDNKKFIRKIQLKMVDMIVSHRKQVGRFEDKWSAVWRAMFPSEEDRKAAIKKRLDDRAETPASTTIAEQCLAHYKEAMHKVDDAPSCDIFVDTFIRIFWLYSGSEFSPENIDFLMQCEKMKRKYTKDKETDSDSAETAVKTEMKRLYDTYIKDGSDMELNIAFGTRKKFTDSFEPFESEDESFIKDKLAKTPFGSPPFVDPTEEGLWHSLEAELHRLVKDAYERLILSVEYATFIKNYKDDLEKCKEGEGEPSSSGAHSEYYNHELNVFNDGPYHEFSQGYQPQISDEYTDLSGSRSSLLIGGVVGASSVIIIMLIFCIGLAFGMVIYWGYSQKMALERKRHKEAMQWIEDDEDRNEV